MRASYHVDSSVIRLFRRLGRWDMGPEVGWTPGPNARRRHGSRRFFAKFVTFLVALPVPAFAAQSELISPQAVVMISVITAGAFALAGGLWALAERQSSRQLRRNLRISTARARALLCARDAWLSASRESLLVWGADMGESLSFGQGAELMQACLSGADAQHLSSALDALAANGVPFMLTCATSAGRKIAVRGRPAGGFLTVFFD